MADRTFQVRMPLFDRLVDRDLLHTNIVQMRTLDRGGVRESVRRELEQLFNTRCPVPAHLLAGRPRTVIDYGIPDFSTIFTRNPHDWTRLAAILREAVAAYEPRLANVTVRVEPAANSDDQSLIGTIAADLVVDGIPEAVLFTTTLRGGEAEVR